jgi:hypothetical protein
VLVEVRADFQASVDAACERLRTVHRGRSHDAGGQLSVLMAVIDAGKSFEASETVRKR